MLSLLSPQQTCTPRLYSIDLGIGPWSLAEPRRQFATVEELAFLRLDGAEFSTGVPADRAIGVCNA